MTICIRTIFYNDDVYIANVYIDEFLYWRCLHWRCLYWRSFCPCNLVNGMILVNKYGAIVTFVCHGTKGVKECTISTSCCEGWAGIAMSQMSKNLESHSERHPTKIYRELKNSNIYNTVQGDVPIRNLTWLGDRVTKSTDKILDLAATIAPVWPSGLRRCAKAAVRKGVGSTPTAVMFIKSISMFRDHSANPTFVVRGFYLGFRIQKYKETLTLRLHWAIYTSKRWEFLSTTNRIVKTLGVFVSRPQEQCTC